MKFPSAWPRLLPLPILSALLLFAGSAAAQQGTNRIGDIVTNNFTLQNRYRWTNDNGQIFTSTNTFRLSDFAGRIVFLEFFAYW